jgi:plasmid maintenance system antidote protein VapI
MAKKDHRYKTVKILIQGKFIKNFKQIFDHIPKTVVASALHTNNNRMTDLINEPADLRVGEMYKISKMIGVPFLVVAALVEVSLKGD